MRPGGRSCGRDSLDAPDDEPANGGDDGGAEPAQVDDVTALRDVADLLERATRELTAAARHAHHVAELRTSGRSWREIVREEQQPLVVERLSTVLDELGTARSRLRHEQARALVREDVTITEISRLFGVSRQRASILVNRTHVR